MKYLKYLIVFTLILTACKSNKNVTGSSGIKKISSRKVAKKHKEATFNKKTVDAKLKVNYKDAKENIGFSVRMKIKKDEVIWLKGTKFITVFKAKITPKKVSYYSPHFKNYFEGDFSMLQKFLGTEVNFNQLQNMLLGQSMLDVTDNKQEVAIVEKSYQLSPKKQSNLFDIFFFVNPTNFKLNKQSLVNSAKSQRLDISYSEYIEQENELFPKKISINAKQKDKFTKIDMLVRSLLFDTELSIPFKIPSNYKEIKL